MSRSAVDSLAGGVVMVQSSYNNGKSLVKEHIGDGYPLLKSLATVGISSNVWSLNEVQPISWRNKNVQVYTIHSPNADSKIWRVV
jgi:hypothetical protein